MFHSGIIKRAEGDFRRNQKIIFQKTVNSKKVCELNNEFLPPIELKPLVQDLQFIENKKHWAIHLTPLLRKIPQEDYKKIVSTR